MIKNRSGVDGSRVQGFAVRSVVSPGDGRWSDNVTPVTITGEPPPAPASASESSSASSESAAAANVPQEHREDVDPNNLIINTTRNNSLAPLRKADALDKWLPERLSDRRFLGGDPFTAPGDNASDTMVLERNITRHVGATTTEDSPLSAALSDTDFSQRAAALDGYSHLTGDSTELPREGLLSNISLVHKITRKSAMGGGGPLEDSTMSPWYAAAAANDSLGDLGNHSFANETLEFFNTSVDYGGAPVDELQGFPFPSLYGWEHIILSSIVVTVIMLVIVIGNGLVIWAIIVDRNLKGLQNWFIASLAASDFFVGLFIMPLSLANELMGYWYFGNIMCELWLATDVLLCTASILNLCLISLDRYWSVTRAVSYVKGRTKKRAVIMITIVWVLAMVLSFPPLAGWKRPQPTKFGYPLCVLSEETGYVIYSVLGSFWIPMIVMLLVYFKIYLAARSRARRNLKKPAVPKHIMDHNGKSMSTTTTTTTSFSNPSKHAEVGKLSTQIERSSEEDEDTVSHEPAVEHHPPAGDTSAITATTDSAPEPGDPQDIKLTVTNRGALHVRSSDEKCKLLSDDTDSACDTPVLAKAADRMRRIHFSEETTDSASDYNAYATKSALSEPKGKDYSRGGTSSTTSQKTEENLKPLLEDSQAESDSQRESDRNSNSSKVLDRAVGSNSSEHANANANANVTASTDLSTADEKTRASKKRRKLNADEKKHRFPHQLSPSTISAIGSNVVRRHHHKDKKHTQDDPERKKRKLARAKERRAIIVLGIIMVSFMACWMPFFSLYPIAIAAGLEIPGMVFATIFWLGYCNSALNPIIYTIFNREFRQAFHKILFKRRAGRL